jgi:hypothetical protein
MVINTKDVILIVKSGKIVERTNFSEVSERFNSSNHLRG